MNEREKLLDRLFLAMIHFDANKPELIQHFTKVHAFAKLIGELEGMPEEDKFILEAAAYVHDIGIKVAIEKYGYENGKLQEQEGPPAARKLMEPLGFNENIITRVEYLVGHHHTYSHINALDYQILVEADFLVNLYENNNDKENILAARNNIFKTVSGIRILNDMFDLS